MSISIEALANGYWATHAAWEKAKAEGRVRDERGNKPDVPGFYGEVRYGYAGLAFDPALGPGRVPQSNDDG